MMVGNGVTNWHYDTNAAYIEMGYWHSLYSTTIYDKMQENNCDYGESGREIRSDICDDLDDQFQESVKDINIYDILGYCYHNQDETPERYGTTMLNGEEITYKRGYTAEEYTPWIKNAKSEETA